MSARVCWKGWHPSTFHPRAFLRVDLPAPAAPVRILIECRLQGRERGQRISSVNTYLDRITVQGRVWSCGESEQAL